jgi:hypothetical protein
MGAGWIGACGGADFIFFQLELNYRPTHFQGSWLMLILRVMDNPHGTPEPGILFAVRPTKTHTLGRGSKAEIHLAVPGVSREHFRLSPESRDWYLEDLGSKNGTLLNGSRVRGREVIDVGDIIEIASIHIEVTKASLLDSTEEADKIGTVYIDNLDLTPDEGDDFGK